jgi:hypothetical protein
MSLIWGFMPIPVAALTRRRAQRRRVGRTRDEQPPDTEAEAGTDDRRPTTSTDAATQAAVAVAEDCSAVVAVEDAP